MRTYVVIGHMPDGTPPYWWVIQTACMLDKWGSAAILKRLKLLKLIHQTAKDGNFFALDLTDASVLNEAGQPL